MRAGAGRNRELHREITAIVFDSWVILCDITLFPPECSDWIPH